MNADPSRYPITRALVLALAACTSCASWDETRRDIITPLNKLVHADYPAAVRSGDTLQVTRLFAPELRAWAARDTRNITGRFSRIDRSRCVIHDSAAPDGSGAVRTTCVLRVDGISLGERVTWEVTLENCTTF